MPARGLPGVSQPVLYVAYFEPLFPIMTDLMFCHQFHGPTKVKLFKGGKVAWNYVYSSMPSAIGMYFVMVSSISAMLSSLAQGPTLCKSNSTEM